MLEVFTTGGGEFIVNVLNAVSAWTGSGGWRSLITVVLVIGLIYALTTMAFNLNWRTLIHWFLGATLMYGCLIIPTYDVKVTDRINPSLAPATVSDVPLGLALVAHLSSLTGDYLTRTAETVFVMPNSLQYSNSGIIYGARLYDRTRNFKIRDPRVRANLTKYYQQCLFYDFMLGHKNPAVVLNSDNMLDAMGPGSPARAMPYIATDLSTSIITCEVAYNNLRTGDIPAEQARELQSQSNAAFPGMTPALALQQMQNDLPAISGYFHGGTAQDANRIFQQRSLTEAFLAARAGFGAADGDAFAALRAEEQARNTYNSIGTQAMTWVPLLHIVLTCAFYALFPILFPLWLIPQTGVLAMKAFFTSFFYLAAWGPLYVIIHMFIMYRTEESMTAISPDGITPAGIAGIDAVNLEAASTAGMLLIAVPVLALGLTKGAMALANQAQALLNPAQGAAEAAATEQTTGNYAYGNTSILNSSSFLTQAQQWNTAPSQTIGHGTSTFVGADGALTKETADGYSVVDHRPGISNIGQSLGLSQRLDRAQSLVGRELRQRQETVGNALTEARSEVARLQSEQRVGNRSESTTRQFSSSGTSASIGTSETGSVSSSQQSTVGNSGSITDTDTDVTTDTGAIRGSGSLSTPSGGSNANGQGQAGGKGAGRLPVGAGLDISVERRRSQANATDVRESISGGNTNQSGFDDRAEESSRFSQDYRSGTESSSSQTGYSDNSTALSQAQERVQSLTLEARQLELQSEELARSTSLSEATGISRNEDLTNIVQSRYEAKADELGLTVPAFNNIARTRQEADNRGLVVDRILQDVVRERVGDLGRDLPDADSLTGNLERPADFEPSAIPSGLPRGAGGGGAGNNQVEKSIESVRQRIDQRQGDIKRQHGSNTGAAQRRRRDSREAIGNGD